MQTVSRFEANLLQIAYYFLGQETAERALPLVEKRMRTPACLSRGAVRLVQEALAKGCVYQLAVRGGWRAERHLRDGKASVGRVWERTPEAERTLAFSQHALSFLMWITAARPGDREPFWQPTDRALTTADLLLLYFAHVGLRQAAPSLGLAVLLNRPPFVRHGLCRLAYPEEFLAAPGEEVPDFAPWTTGLGAVILEALQKELEQRWLEIEASKAAVVDPAALRSLGAAQERVLTAFLTAVESAGRIDLARFLLRTAAKLLTHAANPAMWVGNLDLGGARLSERAATYHGALTFLRMFERLETWTRRARGVGYFDEGYAAGQLWKADWEECRGDELAERARGLIRELDPLAGRTRGSGGSS